MATLQGQYKAAIKKGLLDQSVTEEQFVKILENPKQRKAYYDNANQIISGAYGTYDSFSNAADEVLAAYKSQVKQPTPTQEVTQAVSTMPVGAAADSTDAAITMLMQQKDKEQKAAKEERARINSAQLPMSDDDRTREEQIRNIDATLSKVGVERFGNRMPIGDDREEVLQQQKQLEQERATLQGQRKNYMAEPTTVEEARESWIDAWSENTEEGKQAKSDMEKAVLEAQNYLLEEFKKSDTFKSIYADVQGKVNRGELSVDAANKELNTRLEEAFVAENEELLNAEKNTQVQAYVQRALKADNGWLKRQEERLGEQALREALDENLDELNAAMRADYDAFAKSVGNGFGAAQAKSNYIEQQQLGVLGAAAQLLRETNTILSATKKGEEKVGSLSGEILRHTGDKLKSIATFGMSDISSAMYQANVLKKIAEADAYDNPESVLDRNELVLYDAIVANMAAQIVRAENTSHLANAGKLTAEMIPFVMEIAIGKGLFSGMTKAAQRGVSRSILRSLGNGKWRRVIASQTGELLSGALESAAIAAIAPSTYKQIFQNEAKIDPTSLQLKDGKWTVGEIDQQSTGSAIWNAYRGNWREMFTETGGLTQFAAGFLKVSPLGKLIQKTPIGKLSQIMDNNFVGKMFKQTAYHGIAGELSEEWENTFYEATEAFLKADKGKKWEAFGNVYGEFVKPETQVPMLISFSLPAIFGGAVTTGQMLAINSQYKNSNNNLRDTYNKYYPGVSEEHEEYFEDLLNDVRAAHMDINVEDYPRWISRKAALLGMVDNGSGVQDDVRKQEFAAALSAFITADVNLAAIQEKHAKKQRQVQAMIHELEAAEQRIAQDTHTTDGMMYHVEVGGMTGYVVSGPLALNQYDGEEFARATNSDIVTVRMEDGSVKQVAANQIKLLEQPQAVAEVLNFERRRLTAKMNNLDRFKVGDVIYITENGQPVDGSSSRVVDVTDEGVVTEVVLPDGTVDTTTIPHDVAESGLSTSDELVEEGAESVVLEMNNGSLITMQKTTSGDWMQVAPKDDSMTLWSQEDLDEFIAKGGAKIVNGEQAPSLEVASGNGVVSEETGEIGQPTGQPIGQPIGQPQAEQPAKPYATDEQGNPAWAELDVEQSVGALLSEMEDDKELSKQFAQSQIAAAKSALNKANKRKPQATTDLAAFRAEAQAIKQEQQAAQAELSKWENVLLGIANYKTAEEQVEAQEIAEDIQPIGVSDFGEVYDQFKGKPKEAIEFLKRKKSGEALGALSHSEIGEIDLVWGYEGTGKSDGFGLSKLLKYHPEVVDNLQEILDDMHIVSQTETRIQLESEKYKAAVRLTWDGERKTWLLTAFEKNSSVSDKTTDTTETHKGKQDDTALLQNTTISADKGTKNVPSTQENVQKTAKKQQKNADLGEKTQTDTKKAQEEEQKSVSTEQKSVEQNEKTQKVGEISETVDELDAKLAAAEAETDTNPTEAQKKAENYKQGHVTLWGLPFTIENPKGSVRRGTDANGKQWEQVMNNTYGKIRRTEGVDGDHIDVFFGPNLHSDKVFVVDQRNVNTGEFDEHKVMLGFDSMQEAQDAYLSNYEEGWQGMGPVTETTMDEFKKWIESSHRKTKAFSEYKSVKKEGGESAPATQTTITEDDITNLLSEDAKKAEKAWVHDAIEEGENAVDMPILALDLIDEAVDDYMTELIQLEKTIQEKKKEFSHLVAEINTLMGNVLHAANVSASDVAYLFEQVVKYNSAIQYVHSQSGYNTNYDTLKYYIGNTKQLLREVQKFEAGRHAINNASDNVKNVIELSKRQKEVVGDQEKFYQAYQQTKNALEALTLEELDELMNILKATRENDMLYTDAENRASEIRAELRDQERRQNLDSIFDAGGTAVERPAKVKAYKYNPFDFTANDPNRPTFSTAFHEDGYVVSTDAHILVAIKQQYDAKLEGKMTNKKGEVVNLGNYKFPNWKSVFANAKSKATQTSAVNVEDLRSFLEGAQLKLKAEWQSLKDKGEKVGSFKNYMSDSVVMIRTSDGIRGYSLGYLSDFANVLSVIGAHKVYFQNNYNHAGSQAIVAETKKGKVILMPKLTDNVRFEDGNVFLYDMKNAEASNMQDLAKKLGAKGFHIVSSKEELPKEEKAAYRAIQNGVKVTGWYNPKTNQAYIYAPNVNNTREMYLTLLHELVAHKGLRDMLGKEKFDKLCRDVWNMMSEQDKLAYAVYVKQQVNVNSDKMQEIIAAMTEEQKAQLLNDTNVQLEAADEYMAHFAETGVSEQERSIWQRIVDAVKDLLRKIGINIPLSDADIARMLYESNRRFSSNMTMKEVAQRIAENNGVYENLSANAKNMGLSDNVRFRISEEQDKAYATAVERGDIAAAEEMLRKAAEEAGYLPQSDYQDAHGAPRASVEKEDFTNAEAMQEAADNGEDTNLWAVAQGISIQPDDYFSPQGPRWYGYSNQSGMESYAALSSAIRSINSQLNEYGEVKDMPIVKVYRTVPTNIVGEQLESEGQWVTPSLEYAIRHGENRFDGNYRIIEQEVPADQLWWDGMDPREWGFDDGTNNVYQNTKNNRKLFEVTYDQDGNLIPLSQRFDTENEDIRFRVGTEVVEMGDNTLVGLHNISTAKLRKAIKQGGLANPSVAVINMAIQDHEQYGDITLVMPSSMIDSTTGRNAGTYTGDIWSPTYPYVERKMSSKGSDKYYDALNKAFEGKHSGVKSRTALIFVNMLDNQGNPDNLAYWYMLEKGIAPTDVIINSGISDDIKQRFEPLIDKRFAGDLTTEERELLLGIAAELEGKTTEELLQAAQEAKKRYEDTVLANEKASQFSKNIALSAIDEIDTYGVRLNVLSDTMRRVREAIDKDGGVDVNATISAAVDYVQENGLKGDFDAWLDNLDDRFDIEEVIFDGYTRDGDRKYVKNTIANASRLMNQQPIQNATSHGGLSATRGQLVERMSTLAQIRANKHRLAAINEYEDEQWKAMQDEWFNEIINPLSEMQNIDDNPFINMDIAEQRLLEAIMEKDPIAYLNREYRYKIEKDSKFAKALKDLMGRLKALPSKYFETKFKRPVMLNEFVSAVVPQDLPQDLKDSLKEAGLDVYEYNDTEGSRREATIEATNGEGVRFRIGDDHLSVEENANLIENNLHNSEKNSTFVAEMEKLLEIDTVSAQEVKQFIDKVRNGRKEKTLQMGRLRMDGTSRGNDLYWCGAVIGEAVVLHQEKSGVSSQSSLLGSNLFIEVAKQLNAFTDYNEFVKGLGVPIGQGQEAIVWVKDDDGDVVKALHYNALLRDNTQQVPAIIERISWFNHLFPENQLSLNQVLGLHNNNLYVEVTQGYVDGEHPNFEDWGEVGAFINQMQAKGFEVTVERGGEIILYKDNFEVRDLVGRNVIKDEDGVFHVIDANISQEVKEKPEIRFSVDNSSDDIRFRISNDNQRIFISNAEKAVEQIKQDKATPQQWKAMIEKQGGLKAGEDKWLGLSEWLDKQDKKTITKQEVLDFIAENQIQIEEVAYVEGSPYEDESGLTMEQESNFASFAVEFGNLVDDEGLSPDDAYQEMIDKYGEDFSMAFELEDDRIYPARDYYGGLTDAAKYFLGEDSKTIHGTRLQYTTKGLENNREIALTVPTIESWNENDEIHFGDAGEGRAIAWVRFGEANSETEREVVDHVDELKFAFTNVNGGDVYSPQGSKFSKDYAVYGKLANGEMGYVLYIRDKQTAAYPTLDAALDALNAHYKANPRKVTEYDKVLVIDEIQSKRHQEGREKGYKGSFDKAALEQAQKESKEYGDYLYEKYIKGKRKGEDFLDYATEEEKAKFRELSDKVAEINKLRYHGIPNAPFDKNWHELAFKRIIRYAAENGFDKVAWTTGAQQAERYDIGSTINVIDVNRDEIDDDIMDVYIYTTKQFRIRLDVSRTTGKVVYVADMYKEFMDKPLSELIGKDLANDIIKSEYEHHRYEGDGLRIGGEGMKGFYDKMLPSFVSKYVKKWGAKVGEVTMPQLQEGYQTMHSVDITPEMKEDVMEGQPMFRISSDKNDVQNVATEIWNKYQYDGELESMRDVAEYAEEHMPKNAQTQALFDAIDAYRIEEEEDRMYYGMRGDLEPFEDAIMDEVERLMNATTQSKLTESEQLTFDALQEVAADAGLDVTVGVSQEEALKAITQSDEDVESSIRTKPAPKKTGIGYKVFYRGKDGKLYPPMVANPNGADTPIGVWLDADAAPMAGESKTGRPQVKAGGKGTQGGSGTLAYRPGWHLGEIPYALQFNRKDDTGERTLFPKDFVWAEVEYADDVNYQEEADSYGYTENGKYRHSYAGLPRVPENGSYRYRTNPNPLTDPWIITGAMKVNRVLTKEEVDEIVRKAGREPQPVELLVNPINGTILGYAQGNRIVLTREGMNPETMVHEYTHVWAKAMQRNNRAGWENIMEIFKQSPLWDDVVNDPNYQGLKTDDAICSEVLARYSGKYGAERLDEVAREMILEEQQSGSNLGAARVRALINRARTAIKSFWKWVGKNLFGITKFDSMEDVADRVLYDLLNATKLDVDTNDKTVEADIERPSADFVEAMRAWNDANPYPIYTEGESLGAFSDRLTAWKEARDAYRAELWRKSQEKIESADPISEPMVASSKPVRKKDETPLEYAQRLKQWQNAQIDSQLSEEYTAEMNRLAGRLERAKHALVDAALPIEEWQNWLIERGATMTSESNAYQDMFLAQGRVSNAAEELRRDIIQKLTRKIAAIIESKKLDDVDLRWHNMDVPGTKRTINGNKLSVRELIGVYCQAKDCEEAEEKGLPDRGKAGFKNNLDVEYTDIVNAVETRLSREDITELWYLINQATKYALDYDLEAGRISQDTYDEFADREYYVPQRGWRERDESGLIEEYEPVGKRGHDPYNAALVKARGRQSLAADPFAYIMSIDHSSIVSSENNKIKQKMLQFCLDNEEIGLKTGAFRVKKYWLMHEIDPDTGKIRKDEDGVPITLMSYTEPKAEDFKHDKQVKDEVKRIEKEITKRKKALEKELAEHGDTNYAKALQRAIANSEAKIEDLNDTLIIAFGATNTHISQRTRDEKLQHEVQVMKDGQRYVIELQDEKVANAINKKFKQHQEALFNVSDKMRNATRFMSAMLTQYNPEFAASNFVRDFQVAVMTLTNENPKLLPAFLKNFAVCQRAVMAYAFADKVQDRTKYVDSDMGRLLEEYMKSGAPTGFSYMQDLKTLRKDFDSMVNQGKLSRGVRSAVGIFSMFTEISETAVRFAAYAAARKAGWAINDAAYMSKELTTNFDRAGEMADSGWMSWFSFMRATINGNVKFFRAFKKLPIAYSITAAVYFAMGLINQFANPSDPDDEVWASDYVRENNFVIGKWRIPAAHFMRIFYSAGVNMASWMQGERIFGHAVYNSAMSAFNEILPNYMNVPGIIWEWSDEMQRPVKKEPYMVLRELAPTPVSPIADVWVNRNFMGGKIIREPFARNQNNVKDIAMTRDNTLPIYRAITEGIYTAVGGDLNSKYKSDDNAWTALFDISGSQLEHVVEGYAPAAMDMLATTANMIYDAVQGNELTPDKITFVRKFYNQYTPQRAYDQQYWLLKGRVQEYQRKLNDYEENNPDKYELETRSKQYKAYEETNELIWEKIENPTTEDVKRLMEANKQWVQARK